MWHVVKQENSYCVKALKSVITIVMDENSPVMIDLNDWAKSFFKGKLVIQRE